MGLPFAASSANHMMIQILPVDTARLGTCRESLEAVVKKQMPGQKLIRVGAHNEVVNHLNDDSSTPYVYFEIPGDNTAKGRQIERYLYVGGPTAPRVPLNLGRMVACHVLDCMEKVDWKLCKEERDKEKQLAMEFREKFKPFQPSAK